LIAEQISYYRARAPEYDDTVPYDPAARSELLPALERLAPYGTVLELAPGTGQWTAELAKHATQVTAVDASPEMIAINRARLAAENVDYIRADLFSWTPPERYELAFFSDWLSHVPPQRFEDFWAMVAECLEPDGKVFLIDELPAVAALERILDDAIAPAVERPVGSGERYRAIKVFYEPATLVARLAQLGWDFSIATVGWRFYYGVGTPTA
jgi:demethylmenaquinone methyltransferase/2-methoxy-6-polyprenyl-1,4-benzoquinol methylase